MRTTINLDEELVVTAIEFLGVKDISTLIDKAVRDMVEREASRRMARLSGSSPGLKLAPRRRLKPDT